MEIKKGWRVQYYDNTENKMKIGCVVEQYSRPIPEEGYHVGGYRIRQDDGVEVWVHQGLVYGRYTGHLVSQEILDIFKRLSEEEKEYTLAELNKMNVLDY